MAMLANRNDPTVLADLSEAFDRAWRQVESRREFAYGSRDGKRQWLARIVVSLARLDDLDDLAAAAVDQFVASMPVGREGLRSAV